jgi:hypothetical protein
MWPYIVAGIVALLLVGLIGWLLWPVDPDYRHHQDDRDPS